MSFKHKVSRLISFVLIGTGLYQTIYSSLLILFVYPKLNTIHTTSSILLKEGLVEKAIIYWLIIITDGLYGFFLLFNVKEKAEIIHLIVGIIISVFSIFFITQTPITGSPINFLWLKYIRP